MPFRVLALASAALLAYPALAADSVALAGPPVDGGDMECVVATALIAGRAGRVADDATKSQADRKEAADRRSEALLQNSFFLGRLSMMGPQALTSKAYHDASDTFEKLTTTDKVKVIQACESWAQQSRQSMVDPWVKH